MVQISEGQFEVRHTNGNVIVTFMPSQSVYTYMRLTDQNEIKKFGKITPMNVRHGNSGDTGSFDSREVMSMAYRLAVECADKK